MRFCKGRLDVQTYWRPDFGQSRRISSRQDAVEALEHHLQRSVQYRLMADVPVGAYLSGGLDSSVLVALMRQLEPGTIKTFSIGFDSAMDETSQARDIAARFETEHHELQCRDADFEHLDRLVWHLDEPIGDVIVLPMYLLAREARRHVKVDWSSPTPVCGARPACDRISFARCSTGPKTRAGGRPIKW
ncbi:hypothetical protein C2W62_35795 [Candidatus Entotheonella serta]|nr:hypothetical protein C2W62_35795 [Candidatus Entotheonella serta]